jgi:hypothetical protein
MPQDQSQLWHLLALLAELKQGGLACCWLHKLRNPIEHTPVLLRHANLRVRLQIVRGTARHDAVAGDSCPIVARDPLVVLLLGLCSGSGGGGGLCLSLRLRLRLRRLSLRLELTVLAYMVIGVLVVALRPLARVVLLLLREEVLHLLHL